MHHIFDQGHAELHSIHLIAHPPRSIKYYHPAQSPSKWLRDRGRSDRRETKFLKGELARRRTALNTDHLLFSWTAPPPKRQAVESAVRRSGHVHDCTPQHPPAHARDQGFGVRRVGPPRQHRRLPAPSATSGCLAPLVNPWQGHPPVCCARGGIVIKRIVFLRGVEPKRRGVLQVLHRLRQHRFRRYIRSDERVFAA